jgi:hypothetical protein
MPIDPCLGQELIGMLTVYFDDSGTHSSAEVTLLAGLFGLDNQWSLFEDLWSEVLGATVPNKSVSSFHAFDCYNSIGDFSGWKGHVRQCGVIFGCS